MTPLRQRMIDAMVLRGLSPRTRESYADAIYGMAKHYRRDPAQYSAQEVGAYLLHLINERHLSYSTMNQAACAARFLYEKVLGRERELFPIAMVRVPQNTEPNPSSVVGLRRMATLADALLRFGAAYLQTTPCPPRRPRRGGALLPVAHLRWAASAWPAMPVATATGSPLRAGTGIARSVVHGPRTPGCRGGPRCCRCRTRTWSSRCHTV